MTWTLGKSQWLPNQFRIYRAGVYVCGGTDHATMQTIVDAMNALPNQSARLSAEDGQAADFQSDGAPRAEDEPRQGGGGA